MAEEEAAAVAAGGGAFALLSDDIVLNIVVKLDGDPRDWARVACVSTRFASLVRDVCCRSKCFLAAPSLVADLLPSASSASASSSSAASPPGGWAALHKLSVCCPGLLHAGVLLENSDFGLERELGPDHNFRRTRPSPAAAPAPPPPPSTDCSWSLFDDLYLDAAYDASESHTPAPPSPVTPEPPRKRPRPCSGPAGSHLAPGAWNLSREQGNKLLASRFRSDCLYICDWPGCLHAEERRKYMLFRGVFKNFKKSRVWRTINDAGRSRIGISCAFCSCREVWDLLSAFCLRRVFGYHDDGEPVVRAYVCENGHVSGAWTERPMYA